MAAHYKEIFAHGKHLLKNGTDNLKFYHIKTCARPDKYRVYDPLHTPLTKN